MFQSVCLIPGSDSIHRWGRISPLTSRVCPLKLEYTFVEYIKMAS